MSPVEEDEESTVPGEGRLNFTATDASADAAGVVLVEAQTATVASAREKTIVVHGVNRRTCCCRVEAVVVTMEEGNGCCCCWRVNVLSLLLL